jgi:acetyl esterase/lipase
MQEIPKGDVLLKFDATPEHNERSEAMKLVAITMAAVMSVGCAVIPGKVKQEYRVERDVAYKTVAESTLAGDLYLPNKPGLKPAVVVVHGGGWTKRRGEMTGISKRLAKAGFAVFNITYRLAPDYLHPAQENDVSAALEWLYAHAEDYDIDKQAISGWGYSAGAHLILMAGLDRDKPPFLRSIVAGGTPADLTAWPRSPLVLKLIGKPYVDAAQQWYDASPVNRVTENSPPVFLYHGARDSLVETEQMEFMQQALKEKAVPVETYTISYVGHIGAYLFGGGAEKRAVQFTLDQLASAPR